MRTAAVPFGRGRLHSITMQFRPLNHPPAAMTVSDNSVTRTGTVPAHPFPPLLTLSHPQNHPPAAMTVTENSVTRTDAVPFGRGRVYTIVMQFHPEHLYPEELGLKFEEIAIAFTRGFVPKLAVRREGVWVGGWVGGGARARAFARARACACALFVVRSRWHPSTRPAAHTVLPTSPSGRCQVRDEAPFLGREVSCPPSHTYSLFPPSGRCQVRDQAVVPGREVDRQRVGSAPGAGPGGGGWRGAPY